VAESGGGGGGGGGGYSKFRDNKFIPSKKKSFLPGMLVFGVVSDIQMTITNQQTTLPDIPEGPRLYFKKL